MKSNTGFFFYYTTAAITALVIGSIFFLPSPLNIAISLAFLPPFIFFWIKITNPQKATESVWSVRVVGLFLALAGLFIFGFHLNSAKVKELENAQEEIQKLTTTTNTEVDQTASLSAQIATLEKELSEIKNASPEKTPDPNEITELLNTLDTSKAVKVPVGKIEISSGEEINIFEKSSIDSRILGIATANNTYDFLEKSNGWYNILFADEKSGWVKSDFVKEIK